MLKKLKICLIIAFLLIFAKLGFAHAALINCYIFDNNANDSCGSTNGAVTGATTLMGRFNLSSGKSAYTFDGGHGEVYGDRDRIVFNNTDFQYTDSTPFTFELWFKSSKDDATNQILFNISDNNSNGHIITKLNSDEKLDILIYCHAGGKYRLIRTTDSFCDGNWHHTVYSYDGAGNNPKIYVDGIYVAQSLIVSSLPLSGNFYNATCKTILGAQWNQIQSSYKRDFLGELGGFRNYDIELNATQIRNLYKRGRKTF